MSHWSLGVVIGLPITLFFLLVSVAWIAVTAVVLEEDRWPAFFLGAVVLVGTLVLGTLAFFPFSPSYHRWYQTSGTVAQVGGRLLADGNGGTNQRFVIRFTDGRERACDDTRCSLLHPGDQVTLFCKREYQWASTPGWGCNYVRSSEES